MTATNSVVLILGSGPNVLEAQKWPKEWFDSIVVVNNAWRVRPDWDVLVFPEDFPADRKPPAPAAGQVWIEADAFVPAQNHFGGFIMAGATMAYTTAYWALHHLRPRVMAFMGCDMTYAETGATHFYGTGTADPLRADISLRDLGAKSARLAVLAAQQGCACVNLSKAPSALLFERADADGLRKSGVSRVFQPDRVKALQERESALGYTTPDGRYLNDAAVWDMGALAEIDQGWRGLLRK
ncbi:hypothetical protein Z946_1418 [Sulfitobacter noctilucicola]|uniref:Uncharacterized protein n=1 Tax=Sulfitobacter noctilucicola TaxID=1342301 RepID=A0A7W6Q4J8_9RHOB|nr:hypothetical protein [Sulfitobacter noctilucicola]KIN62558.1 hypothetical protein Z946_1418 [Sulfitobacter noctilucicola]MBB4172912.1 hypothetical protein [Sulfitobacter noctilucicola]